MQKNLRADRLGWILQHHTAELITALLEHVSEELAAISHYPGQSTNPVSGGGLSIKVLDENGQPDRIPVTSVEAAVFHGTHWREAREDLRDRLDGLEVAINELNRFCRRKLGTRLPRHIVELCDGRDYDGAKLPWVPYSHDPANGWIDPTCREAAGYSGLCPTCLKRMNAWRERNNLHRISDMTTAA